MYFPFVEDLASAKRFTNPLVTTEVLCWLYSALMKQVRIPVEGLFSFVFVIFLV